MSKNEPIAIVGISCKFPGDANDLESFWNILQGGLDVTREAPEGRWDQKAYYDSNPEAKGKTYVTRGGFINGIADFEPEFFGISPREAMGMDPQQRLLLEVAWQALEHAGIPADQLKETLTGIWVGKCFDDYNYRMIRDMENINIYNGLGNCRSISPGRIGYSLGLQGPSIQVDAGCASSLTALHLACQSLRTGESNLGIVGGVNIIVSPETTILMCKAGALSKDGLCKTFDESGDGYVRGEGCGVVIVKRLADAIQDGDTIHAVIRGTAINHGGRGEGLTVPNGSGQEAVYRSALRDAGIEASAVGFIETHGTGTAVGDPIEVNALGGVYGTDRPEDSKLYLGSAKTNIGHLEGAAGMAGLIKSILCLKHGKIAPNLNFKKRNPKFTESFKFEVATQLVDWPKNESAGNSRFAGVSSFGIAGNNTHTILEMAPETEARPSTESRRSSVMVLSARTPSALRTQAKRLQQKLSNDSEVNLADLSFSLLSTRSTLDCRVAFAVESKEELLNKLELEASETDDTKYETITDPTLNPKIAFVFSGQGSQWLGMGLELYQEEAVFRQKMDECDKVIQKETGWSVLKELRASKAESRLDRMDVVQPIIFSMQVSLAALWRSMGVHPSVVVGHSMGEAAAACVVGSLSLEDAAAVICRRTALARRIANNGQMAMVELSHSEALEALKGFEDLVSVAANNGTNATIISGDGPTIQKVLKKLEAQEIFCRQIKVDFASHSPQVDPLLDDLIAALSDLKPMAASVPMCSTVNLQMLTGTELTGAYWAQNLRQPVHFAQSIDILLEQGVESFIELSPHPLLTGAIEEIRREQNKAGTSVASLRREQPEQKSLFESLAHLYRYGLRLSAADLFPNGASRTQLPTYPWEHARYWTDYQESVPAAKAAPLPMSSHPLLGGRVSVAGQQVYESMLSLNNPSWISDHQVAGVVWMPGAAYAELIRAAANEGKADASFEVRRLIFQAPLPLMEKEEFRLQVVLSDKESQASVYSLPTDPESEAEWKLHATAEIAPLENQSGQLDLSALRKKCHQVMDARETYQRIAALGGPSFGPAFQGLRRWWRGEGEAMAEIILGFEVPVQGYGIHPALLDSALQLAVLEWSEVLGVEKGSRLLPFELGEFRIYKTCGRMGVVSLRASDVSVPGSASADIIITDENGEIIAEILQVVFRATAEKGELASEAIAESIHRIEWQLGESFPEAGTLKGNWLILDAGNSGQSKAYSEALSVRGARCRFLGEQTLEEVFSDSSINNVLCLWDEEGMDIPSKAMALANRGMELAKAAVKGSAQPKMWWVTRNAVSVRGEDLPDPAQATLWGMGKAIQKEYQDLKLNLLDIDTPASLVEALTFTTESQTAWREGLQYLPRFVCAQEILSFPEGENFCLRAINKGSFDGLNLDAKSRSKDLGPNEVEIEVRAAGLNFRDVMITLGNFPGTAPLGMECAGVVSALGEKVSNLKVGDRVMAFAIDKETPSETFSRFSVIDERLVSLIPEGISFDQGATIPVAFLTAWHALCNVAKLKKGEKVLIHAAAGGVGMAAIQVANLLGAEVYATASPSKWDVLRSLGVKHIASSRDLNFAETFSEGVDVVLNSLTGEFIDASFGLLKDGGRFVEIGKADIRDAAQVESVHPGLKYQFLDLMQVKAETIAQAFKEVREAFSTKFFSPLPVKSFHISEAEAAFRYMAQAKHIGKIVLTPYRGLPQPKSTVMITGGLSGVGLEIATYLAEQGVGHLLLTGRRGLNTPGAVESMARLEALGAKVTVASVDVNDSAALTSVISSLPKDFPLKGVIHSAVVLDDGMLIDLSHERLEKVMAPKVLGAWNLHQATQDLELDYFVMFSSISGVIGNSGQTAYGAANVFMDALASRRKALGLPAVSIAWGPWAELGLASALDSALKARLSRQGLGWITPELGRRLFQSAIQRSEAELSMSPLDLEGAASTFRNSGDGKVPPFWSVLVKPLQQVTVKKVNNLSNLTKDQKMETILDLVRTQVAQILSLGGKNSIPTNKRLKDLGLDSLMSLELRNRLERSTNIKIPAATFSKLIMAKSIAEYLVKETV